ncbi:MAG: hypothetical protein LBV41_07410 [Cytophagaceae bacterium]|jgi:hypothetical protein|nr:hypothetical protein [Cytophagaceae bacterium]
MEKEALIKIILQDVRELDTLLTAFAGKPEISQTFIRLSRNRVKGILDEIDLLEYLLNTSENEVLPAVETEKSKSHETVNDEKPAPVQENSGQLEVVSGVTDEVRAKPEILKVESSVEMQNSEKSSVTEKKQEEKTPATAIQPQVVAETKIDETVTLGEKLMQGSQSLYDTLSQKKELESAPCFQSRPIKDIKSAIGINDRFYFQRELFGGNADLFNSIIDQLNALKDMDSAEVLLAANFKWDNSNEAVQSFKEIVKRRYL